MIENVMNKMSGTGVFGIISICLFFAFFTGMLLWAVLLKKPYVDSMCELPLEKDAAPNPNSTANPGKNHE